MSWVLERRRSEEQRRVSRRIAAACVWDVSGREGRTLKIVSYALRI